VQALFGWNDSTLEKNAAADAQHVMETGENLYVEAYAHEL
jgi:hypothetical protein